MGNKKILVTGGAGYIGTHCVVELLLNNFDVVIVDDFSNSCMDAVNAAVKLGGRPLAQFYEGDIRNSQLLDKIFSEHKIDAVIHFAAKKAVGESVAKPLLYYNNNVAGTINLLECMQKAGVNSFVFSSSATVYGADGVMPLTEESPLSAVNPYGQTKLVVENILRDVCNADSQWRVLLLRYFNPIGAHPSGEIGEDPQGIPNNLMPYVAQVAVGKREKVNVFGNDYPTKDGTGVRDYIHVVDLAQGHVAALNALSPGCVAVNLGTGNGYSVLDCIRALEKAAGKQIPYEFTDRRPGDSAVCYAKTDKAKQLLGWTAKLNLDDMCRDLWAWQSKNPNGFSK